MLTIILKKIVYFKNKRDLDAKLWIQKALLKNNFNSL